MTERVIVAPVTIDFENCKVHIIEVRPYTTVRNRKRYIVSLQLECMGYRSDRFTLDVENNEELKEQLKVEIAKMKIFILSGKTDFFWKAR